MPKFSKGIFKRILKNAYHFLTVNVRIRTEINIPPINFVTENSSDSVASCRRMIGSGSSFPRTGLFAMNN
jgi:hypothetical protein